MGIDLWKTKYEFMYGHLDDREYDFIYQFMSMSDDGTYYINKNILKDTISKAHKKNVKFPNDLVMALRKAIKDNSGDLSFSIF